MMGSETIRSFQNEAAARAARDGQEPLVLFSLGTIADDVRNAPSLGLFVPAGWRPLDARRDVWAWDALPGKARNGDLHYAGHRSGEDDIRLFVDSSGFGDPAEPALTLGELERALIEVLRAADTDEARFASGVDVVVVGVALVEVGQFQAYLGLFVKDDEAEAQNAPNEDDFCPECDAFLDGEESCEICGYGQCENCAGASASCGCTRCSSCDEFDCVCAHVSVVDNGTLWCFDFNLGHESHEQALAWWEENVEYEPHMQRGQGAFAVEHRYALSILRGLIDAGFTVEVA